MYDRELAVFLLNICSPEPASKGMIGDDYYRIVPFTDKIADITCFDLASRTKHNNSMPNFLMTIDEKTGINFSSSDWHVYGIQMTKIYGEL